MTVGHLLVGDAQHGVVRLAEDVLTQLCGPAIVRARTAEDLADDWAAPLAGCGLVHVHYTDRLFGATCEEAAHTFTALAVGLGARLSVTLHDLPQPGDGGPLFRRRAAAYRRVVGAASAVVVNSGHEAALLADLGAPPRPVSVVPLPIEPAPAGARPGAGDRQVTVLGFVHPGKGHRAALDAMRELAPSVGMVALGRTADGHDDLLPELMAVARVAGRGLRVAGFVDDADLPAALRRAGVPLAPNPRVSASASISTWLTAGRRPLVPAGRYTAELELRCPGALWVYEPAALPTALARALAEPERTWLDPDVRLGPSRAEVAAAYVRAWSRG